VVKIVLADCQEMVRHGLRTLLESTAGYRVIGEASNGKEACRLVQELKPDILIMDIMMDGLDGIDATRTVVKNGFYNVIMLSIHAARCYVSEAVQAGVKAYVLKQSSFADLIKAIDLVAAGKRYFSSSVAELAESCEQEAEINALTPFTHLTSRERDVFYLLAQGFTNSEIAQQLFISRRTAETHRSQIMRKLGLHHMVELVFYALRQGINRDSIAFSPSADLIMEQDFSLEKAREILRDSNRERLVLQKS
jgi:DNA-binding NarL/FixJ family response regulator